LGPLSPVGPAGPVAPPVLPTILTLPSNKPFEVDDSKLPKNNDAIMYY
jgi:hypothetical protein